MSEPTVFPAMDYTMDFLGDDTNATAGQKIEREKLLTFVNVGTNYNRTSMSATVGMDFVPLGKGVEDSALEFDMEVNSVHDILGNTVTTVGSFTTTQTFDPCYAEKGSTLHKKMNTYLAEKNYAKFSQFDVLVVKTFWVKEITTGNYYAVAELHTDCDVHPTSLGGQDYVNMPLSVTLSDDKILGWAKYNKSTKTVTFYQPGENIPS